ncbi:hypothetical protein IFM89_037264 [Coptis chinensis]|uniref:DM2 domain-containing protein n=1 Tax=Coptis chinensis TaxID=261450 RepID=A0A835M603_9MAGN|nr:hypothetical protein IFM89_037264 [Coptis chinensis]
MVNDEEIVNGIESLLRQGTTTQTLNGVIQQLEEKLGLDLSHKVGFIRDLLTNPHFLRPSSNSNSSSKDHFPLQQYPHPQPQFYSHSASQQFIPSHFALPHHQFLHQFQHPEDVHFRYPTLQGQFQHHGFNPHLQRHSFNPNPNLHLQLQGGGGRSDGSVVTTSTTTVVDAGPPETKKESASTGTKRRGGPGGLNKVCGVSPELQVIVGEPALPRTQIVKQLWAYIRKHNLQDPSNKRKIICNDELRLVFETDCTDMFKMNKLLAKHIIPLDPTKAIRRVWEYIKVNQLEDDLNPMMIMCDPKLQGLFGCENVSALGISEMLLTHFSKQS